MSEAMVTGRMPAEKKTRGARILQRDGLNASQAVNLLFDRIIEENGAGFLTGSAPSGNEAAWRNSAAFVDSLSERRSSRFDDMTKAEIRVERLKSRGLM